MNGDINLHNQFRENPTQNVTRCGKGAPDFARMLTGTNSSRIISDTFGNKHLATMLVTRTDFEDVSDVSGYMSSGQTCLEKNFDSNIWRPCWSPVPTSKMLVMLVMLVGTCQVVKPVLKKI